MKTIWAILTSVFLLSCNANNQNNASKDSVVLDYENIPPKRKKISLNPIKTYSETIKSFETTDEFKVSIFETKETFHYLVKIQYKSLEEEDTLKVPNFGIKPLVDIKKSDSIRPSCIIGFYDEKKQFKESKLIYFEDDKLKVHVLKHYAVATFQTR